MNVASTPVAGRMRFTYTDSRPDMRISGTNPAASALSVMSFISALNTIQNGTVDQVFNTVESDLTAV